MFSASKTAGPSGYNISRSVRLRSSASAYLNRTNWSSPNLQKYTWSSWVKRGVLTSTFTIFGGYDGSSANASRLYFNSSDQLAFDFGGAAANTVSTTAVYRDPSAWYHIVLAIDTTQATAANRVLLYVNGVVISSFSSASYPSQNANGQIWLANQAVIGQRGGNYFDGYLTEINYIDGQALTPSSFGSTNATTGVWQPAKYTGTYGTNGFYLNFSDNSAATAAAIGKDYSGNGNNWTPNNISVTAGTTYDSMVDVPTPYADGGNGRGNYSVLNPLDRNGTYGSVTDGNLTQSVSTANHAVVFNSMAMPSGKTYLEVTSGTTTSATPLLIAFGLATQSASRTGYGNTNTWSIKCIDVRTLWNGASSSSNFGGAFTSGTTLQLAYDSATGYMWIGDGTNWYNSTGGTTGSPSAGTNPSFTISTTESLFFFMDCYAGSGTVTAYANFGQRPFTYTPPTGFKALNTYNLPASTITNGGKYMAASLYTGNGTTVTVTNTTNGTSFLPDFVWVKSRNAAISHGLFDSNRGLSKALYSNATNAEFNYGTGSTSEVYALNSNGFSVGSYGNFNANGTTYVGWQWQAGQGSTSSNTNGSITSTVSVNATAGFSVVTYTGTGANATVGHGLGVAPAMMICKIRNSVSTENWYVWHQSISGSTPYIYLNLTNAAVTGDSTRWTAAPTSTLINLGSNSACNGNTGTYVTYCWAQIAGFSKFGSYTGNGSTDGPFVYCGFRPRWVMVKRTDAAGNDWYIIDTERNPYNAPTVALYADSSTAEVSSTWWDVTSNGFKLRNSAVSINGSSSTYIFAAFAEVPFANALAR